MAQILCLEGITGAGKTTQAEKIVSVLEAQQKKFLVINEKNYEPFRRVIISWHKNGANQTFSEEMIKSIAQARAETHRRHFTPLIGEIDYLIFDRSFYTSGIYQADGDLSQNQIINLNIQAGALVPERGLVFLCSPETARRRIDLRRLQKRRYNLPSMHETIPEITKRRGLYLQLLRDFPSLKKIDSEPRENEIFEQVKERLGI